MSIKTVFVLGIIAVLSGCSSLVGWSNHRLPGVHIIRVAASPYAGKKPGSIAYTAGAIRDLTHLASLGDVNAAFDLGTVYYDEKNYPQAFKWFAAAASGGHAIAQYNAGIMSYRGIGTPRDYAQAFRWFKLSAEHGDPQSQFVVASMYFDGKGIAPNRDEGIRWYRQAVKGHYSRAAYDLGALYYNGNGVPRNHVRAYAWFWLAHRWGMNTWEPRMILSQTLSAAELTQGHKLAQRLMRKYDSEWARHAKQRQRAAEDGVHPRPQSIAYDTALR